MESRRWLFPFTHGVDMRAIDTVVRLAGDEGATLVAVSLVPVPPERWSQGARLEHIQQSKDFLEAVKYKAARLQVAIERYEDFTSNAIGNITMLTRDLRCDSIILVSCGEKEILLNAYEKKRLLENPPASLVILRFPTRAERKWHMHIPFLTRLRRPGERQNDIEQEQDTACVG
ncbi:MAG TPA: universal stress protein [Ktedonobacteraceae bacterium]